MKSPFTYFGNKTKVAPLIWQRFGNANTFVDPFGGTFSVLLNRPAEHKLHRKRETIGDLDCLIAHFWRAIKNDAEGVAHYAFDPVSKIDLHARHEWLMGQRATVHRNLRGNPDWFDAKIAGWWVWGQNLFVGKHWCNPKHKPTSTIPYSRSWEGYRADNPAELVVRFKQISNRLRNVVIVQGDWHETIGKGLTQISHSARSIKAVFLDPPYTKRAGRSKDLYVCDSLTVGDDVAGWARARGKDKTYRIALCGLDGEHAMPGWSVVAWTTSRGTGKNVTRERIWFSPGCLDVADKAAA